MFTKRSSYGILQNELIPLIVGLMIQATTFGQTVPVNLAGSLDLSFGSGGIVTESNFGIYEGKGLAIQSDGKIVSIGQRVVAPGGFVLLRHNPNGTLDNSFDTDGIVITTIGDIASNAEDVSIQSDGKIVVAGRTTVAGNPSHKNFAIARYNRNGTLDTSFDGDGIVTTEFGSNTEDALQALVIQADGKIVVAGDRDVFSTTIFARYNVNGSLDSTFDGDGRLIINSGCLVLQSLAVQTDGKLLVAGATNGCAAGGDFAVWRLNTDGSFDATFDGDGKVVTSIVANDSVYALAIQPDGKIIVVGTIEVTPADYDIAVLRYLPNGSLDASFDGDGIRIVRIAENSDVMESVVVGNGGKIQLGGYSVLPDGSGGIKIAFVRLNADGTFDLSFGSNGH